MNKEDAVLANKMKGKRKRDEGASSTRDMKKELRSVGQAKGKRKELLDRKPKFTNFTPLIECIYHKVSMFNMTHEYNMNMTQIFAGKGLALEDLDHKWVNLIVTR